VADEEETEKGHAACFRVKTGFSESRLSGTITVIRGEEGHDE